MGIATVSQAYRSVSLSKNNTSDAPTSLAGATLLALLPRGTAQGAPREAPPRRTPDAVTVEIAAKALAFLPPPIGFSLPIEKNFLVVSKENATGGEDGRHTREHSR